jgi:hypothetical protein
MSQRPSFHAATYNICSDPRFGRLGWRVNKQLNAIKMLEPHVLCLQELALPLTRRAYFEAFASDYHWCEPYLPTYQWVIDPDATLGLGVAYCLWWVTCWLLVQHWTYLTPLVLVVPQMVVMCICGHEQSQYSNQNQTGDVGAVKGDPDMFQPGVNWTGLVVLLRKDTFSTPILTDQNVFDPTGYPCTILGCIKNMFLKPSYMIVHTRHRNGTRLAVTNCHLVDGCNDFVQRDQLRVVLERELCTSHTFDHRLSLGDFNATSSVIQSVLKTSTFNMTEWCCGNGCEIDHILGVGNYQNTFGDKPLVRRYWMDQIYSDHPLVVASVWLAMHPLPHANRGSSRCRPRRRSCSLF